MIAEIIAKLTEHRIPFSLTCRVNEDGQYEATLAGGEDLKGHVPDAEYWGYGKYAKRWTERNLTARYPK